MSETDVALYGGALWLGPLFLVGYLLLVGWMMNAPITKWGARRIAERQEARQNDPATKAHEERMIAWVEQDRAAKAEAAERARPRQ